MTTFTTYTEFSEAVSSEKILLLHIYPRRSINTWTSQGANVWTKSVTNIVDRLFTGSTEVTKQTSSSVDASNPFFYDVTTNTCYYYTTSTSPDDDNLIAEYKLYYSNAPINLTWDLTDNTGEEICYEPRVLSSVGFMSEIGSDQKGISVTGSGNVLLQNNDGHFDSFFQQYTWENKKVEIYSYNRQLDPNLAEIQYRGYITNKSFNLETVNFKIEDELFKTDTVISTDLFTSADGVNDTDIGRSKRVIYGKADNVLCRSTDQYQDGFTLTGTIKGTSGTTTVIGTGTTFLTELSEGDKLKYNDVIITVDYVKSDTLLIVNELNTTFNNEACTVQPSIQWYNKNRTFSVANHAIKRTATTISSITSRNRIVVADATGFESGDFISLDTEVKQIRRVSGNTIVLTTNYNTAHTAGESVSKNEIDSVKFGENGLSIREQDITIDNTASGCNFTITSDAEVNAKTFLKLRNNFTFRNGIATVWLGTPTELTIDTVAQTTGSLYGKYFILEDVDNITTAFWFKDSANVGSSSYLEPAHGADESVAVTLTQSDLTSTEVAEIVIESILSNLDYLQGSSSSNNIVLQSRMAQVIAAPSAGDSGFSVARTTLGVVNEDDIDLTDYTQPRDYLKEGDSADSDRYEILSVTGSVIQLRKPYEGVNSTSAIGYKNVEYIGDSTPVYVNAQGKTDDGTPTGNWIETASDVVKDILTDIGLGDFIDTTAFDAASEDAEYRLSVVLPKSFNDDTPSVRDTINDINQTVFGALALKQDMQVGYYISTPKRTDAITKIDDDDVIKWNMKGINTNTYKQCLGSYRHLDYDPTVQESSDSLIDYSSDHISDYDISNKVAENDFNVYDSNHAQELTERFLHYAEQSLMEVTIEGDLRLSSIQMADKVQLRFNRFIDNPITGDAERIFTVTSIKKDFNKVILKLSDLGNLINRSAIISDDATPTFTSSTADEKRFNNYITDDNGIVTGSEETKGNNLIV